MRAALWSWFLVGQKATLGIGACLLGAASVFQCHGVLLLRNRPLGLRCGAALKAWELHFGVGFLSVQKATLLSTRRFHPSGPWCFAVSQPPARTSLWSCFEGMGAAPAAPPAAAAGAAAAAGPAAELALFYQNPEGTSSLGYLALLYIALHYISLHCIALHCIAVHCIAWHYFALHYIALYFIALHCIALHYIAFPCIALHYLALFGITLHYIALHYISLHCIALYCIAFPCIALHYIALHGISLHYIAPVQHNHTPVQRKHYLFNNRVYIYIYIYPYYCSKRLEKPRWGSKKQGGGSKKTRWMVEKNKVRESNNHKVGGQKNKARGLKNSATLVWFIADSYS